MPITERERATLEEILSKVTTPAEMVKLAGTVYNTILAAKLSSENLMRLGKLIYARFEWQKIENTLRLPFVQATEEFLIPAIPQIFTIVEEDLSEELVPETRAASSAVPEEDLSQITEGPVDALEPVGGDNAAIEKAAIEAVPTAPAGLPPVAVSAKETDASEVDASASDIGDDDDFDDEEDFDEAELDDAAVKAAAEDDSSDDSNDDVPKNGTPSLPQSPDKESPSGAVP